MIDFIVLGLPRSATTWISVWLTTQASLCLHDPFAFGTPESWSRDHRRFGISCTGAYLLPNWLKRQSCPIALIQRDAESCDASLARMGFGDTGELRAKFAQAEGRPFDFNSLWIEDEARELWTFLLPNVSFDALRYRMMREIQIQPHMGKWSFDPAVINEMNRREAGGA